MFAKYYQDELAWLREMGAELANARPEMARYLGEPGADPDVERLLEGFAFLTGRIREKLDDEFPELTHGFMDMFCPHYLRPIPSMTILQVTPNPNQNTVGVTVPRGTPIDSVPVDGTRCRFRTTANLRPAPYELQDVAMAIGHPCKLTLRLRERGGSGPLRLHLAGDAQVSRSLFVALCNGVTRARVRADGQVTERPQVKLNPAGLADDESALPLPPGSFRGFRLLQEYFAFPERFLFVDVHGLDGQQGEFELELEFHELPQDMPPISAANVLLDCVPAVNLFPHDADPVRAEAGRTEYRIRPSGKDWLHYEVHTVEKVSGRVRGGTKQETYEPFFSFHGRDRSAARYYQLRRNESVSTEGSDLYLRLGATSPDSWSELDTISVETTCTNRNLPTRLGPGDIETPTTETPRAFRFRNLGSPSAPIQPPLGDEVHWRLLAHMTLDLRRLADRDSLCTALSLYDFRARTDRQARRRLDNLLGAISDVTSSRGTELLEGVPVNGTEMLVHIDEEKAGGEGEVYLLGTVLDELLAQYVSLNSFSRLRIHCTGNNEVFRWNARIGRRIIL